MKTRRRTPSAASIGRLATSVLAVAAIAGCGQHNQTHKAGPVQSQPSSDSGTAVFAFTTASQLSIVRGSVIIATAPTPAEPTHPVFTPTGRFAAATTADGHIVTTGLKPNTSRTIRAQTTQVFGDHGDTITWWQQPNQLVSLDLSEQSSEPVTTQIDLPGGTPEGSRLISLSARTAVFARPGLSGGREQLIRMDRSRTMTPLAPSPEITNPIRIAIPSFNGSQFAYTAPLRAACPKDGVSIVDTGTGDPSSARMPYSIDDRATTHRVWWDLDGLLHMSIATRPCTADTPGAITAWKLEHSTWVRADPDDALVSRQLGDRAVAVVKPARLNPPAGTLWLSTETGSAYIANNVTDLAAPAIPIMADLADILQSIQHPRNNDGTLS
ncbi:hypothetical protein ACNQVK_00415 [Mycobacterium sp. 134]|uniref:hypothetical protein n=1 Tax=Mycobacterium sp. 134 TaxID=3400425 RepID=UPI003AAE7E6A